MFSKTMSRSAISVLGSVFVVSICFGLTSGIAMAQCPDDALFTQEFLLEKCKFKDKGINPYFILKPCYQLVLETPEGEDERERAVITVLRDKKWIHLGDRKIKTRVVEERVYELEVDEDTGEVEEKLIEISRNWFAICKETDAVYYFGEDSRECEFGFTEDETMCEGEDEDEDEENSLTFPDTTGSWEAGKNDAQPGLIMPGTFLLGSRYFQEYAPNDDAVDRGENVAMGLSVDGFENCVQVFETNPAEGQCDPPNEDNLEDFSKIYCPGIGLVLDESLVLVDHGFVDCDDDKRWRGWKWRHHHRHF